MEKWLAILTDVDCAYVSTPPKKEKLDKLVFFVGVVFLPWGLDTAGASLPCWSDRTLLAKMALKLYLKLSC